MRVQILGYRLYSGAMSAISDDPQIGIWKKFPSIKAYLKAYEIGPIGAEFDKPWEKNDIPNLTRYACGDRWEYGYDGSPHRFPYRMYDAAGNLAYVSIVERSDP